MSFWWEKKPGMPGTGAIKPLTSSGVEVLRVSPRGRMTGRLRREYDAFVKELKPARGPES